MNPFRTNTEQNISESGLNDPSDLIAFHLHELSPERAEAVRRAIEAEPALAGESALIALTLSAIKDVPMQIDDAVLDRNWKALRPSLRTYVRPFARVGRRDWRGRWVFAGALAACAAVLALFAVLRPVIAPPVHEVASVARVEANPLPGLTTELAPRSNEGRSGSSRQPLFKLSPRAGVFRPKADRLEAPVHLLGLAKMPSAPPFTPRSAPRLTLTPEPVAPVATSSSTLEAALTGVPEGVRGRDPKKGRAVPAAITRWDNTADVMLALGGDFIVPQRVSTTHAISAVGAVHQQFRSAFGYRITASYTRPDFSGINSRIYEVAGTYVVRGPRRDRLSTSVEAGGGLLAFLPTNAAFSTTRVYRAAGVLGVNVDYALTRHWGARLAYRAQVFKSPDFRRTGSEVPVSTSVMVSNEPSLGVTYTFGRN